MGHGLGLLLLKTYYAQIAFRQENHFYLKGLNATALQNWGRHPTWSKREIPMLMAAVEAGVMFEAHMECPEDPLEQHTISNIASFLIAAGREIF